MKKLKKISGAIIALIIIACSVSFVFAEENIDYLLEALSDEVEYSEEFKKWQTLSDEEKLKAIQPSTFVIPKTKLELTNPINIVETLAATYESKYDLRDVIRSNVSVKNQGQTNGCWAFASLATLESNLAMRDYREGLNTSKVYDFSERHMAYATSRTFLNNKINENGFSKEPKDGGNAFISNAYLTNGTGAILESDMPFENNEDLIDISEIENKTVQTEVYDTVMFPLYIGNEDTEDLRNAMKSHIKNYGGIMASIHGAQMDSDYYNNDTGAIYCDDKNKCPSDHGVTIIGWDDNYAIENFNEAHRPKEKGAWIIKNSWGERQETTLAEMKKVVFEAFESELKEKNINSAEEIPDDLAKTIIEKAGYGIDGDIVYIVNGDNGYMYISYNDVVVYTSLHGIIKADDNVDYEDIYQYDFYGADSALPFVVSKMYIATVFDKKTSEKELLNQVSIFATETYTCKVYVNPNGDSKAKSDFIPVQLKAGETETFEAGYHTLEFLNPVELTGDKFVVLIEVHGTRTNEITIGVEEKIKNSAFENVKTETGKCFWSVDGAFEKNQWSDFGKMNSVQSNYPNSDSTIKAFTIKEEDNSVLNGISITKQPNKTTYEEGENFDKAGMVVTGTYSNGETKEITNYTIQNGDNLKLGQTSVIIKYGDMTVEQRITVTEKSNPGDDTNNKPDETQKAEVSSFISMVATVKDLKGYTFTDSRKQPYITMNVILSNIQRATKNDSVEYFYYLSSSQQESNMKNWVKITENQTESDKITFGIDTRKISNYSEVATSQNLYLYIKEVAKKGSDEASNVSSATVLKYTGESEIYIDGVKQEKNAGNNNNNNQQNDENRNVVLNSSRNTTNNSVLNPQSYVNTSSEDNTTANKILPKTGTTFLFAIITTITVLGIYMYVKYEKIDK